LPVFLSGLGSPSWIMGDRATVKLNLDAIASSDDRKRLQLAIKKFLPTYRIDPSVADELQLSTKMQDYTDLWLEALSPSSTRVREEILPEGTHIFEGRYEIVHVVGSGGQAIVYEAMARSALGQGRIDAKSVILKEFILPAHAGVNVRKRVLHNIQQEAELLKRLKHPNIVALHDFFVEDQRAYLVLEHIQGVTLKNHILEHGAMPETPAIELGMKLCQILAYLHAHTPPVLHRDFTPDNIMLTADGEPKVIDFNVALQLESSTTNTFVGKHSYVPPEQFRGKATPGSDIYALGATLYFVLTGEEPEPLTSSSPIKLAAHITDKLNAIVMQATDLDATRRFQSAEEMLSALKIIYFKFTVS